MKCKLCDKKFDSIVGLSVHLSKEHKDVSKKDYYDKYLKKEDEGKCYFCGDDAIFKDISKGYHRICKSGECLGKTRATGTPEFLMYKYGLSKKDALLMTIKKAKERGEKIKKSLDQSFIKNKDFFKEKSRQCVEFWLKRGYTEDDAKKKVEDIFNDIHQKTWDKRRNNPELYQDVNTTQIGYWTKKGFSEDEAKEKIKERQRTFTLKSCIDKYGEEEGLKIFNNRQEKWSAKVEDLYKQGKFTRFTKEPYSKGEIELFDYLSNKLKIKDKVHYGDDQFFRYFPDLGRTFSYDFVFGKKLIEFNGDYWHCNPLLYKDDFFNKSKQMFAKDIWNYDKVKIDSIEELGFETLIIWEYDYKNNKEEVIQRCIDFINN